MSKLLPRVGLVMICLILVMVGVMGCSSSPSSAPSSPPAVTTSSPPSSAPISPTSVPKTSPPVSSPAPSSPASSSGTFRIGIMGGLSGPTAEPVSRELNEFEYMLKYVNEVEGGIDGVKFEWKVVDDTGLADGAVVAYKELRDTYKPQLYVAVEDYLFASIAQTMAEDKSILITTSAIVPQLYQPPGMIFSISMPTSDGFAAYINWVLSNWKGPGRPKVGVLYWGDNPSGQQWLLAQGWLATQPVDIVPVTYTIASLDLTTQFTKFKESGVNYIWVHGVTGHAAETIRDSSAVGISKNVPITFMEYVESEALLNLIGPGAEGYYCYQAFSPYSEGTQAAKLYNQIWQYGGKKDEWSDNRLMIALKAVLNALIPKISADIKSNKLTSSAVYGAMNGLSNIETWGNSSKDFGFSPTERVANSAIKMSQFTKTGTVGVSDWIPMVRLFEGAQK
jgi:hypothetical protein